MKFLFRVDASPQIGAGHVMRCLALAQALQDSGYGITFASHNLPHQLEARLQVERMEVVPLSNVQPGGPEDAAQFMALAKQCGAEWTVVDGYHFGADYQRAIKDAGLKLLFMDDYGHAQHYYADLVLNQNIYAHEGLYPHRETNTQLLLGTKYALLRREFRKWQNWQREISPVARQILVTLGGGDPHNVTLQVIRALQQLGIPGMEVKVIVGGSNPHMRELELAVRQSSISMHLQSNVTDMPELMAWADVAVSAGGSTCWEMACMGLPNLIVILADNQRPIAEGLDAAGVSVNLGWHQEIDWTQAREKIRNLMMSQQARREMSHLGRELVDGKGARRMSVQLVGENLIFRPATSRDAHTIWSWRNAPEVRAVSFSTEPIPLESHLRWFEKRLSDPNSVLLMAVNSNDEAIGHVRFEIHDTEAEISIIIAPEMRGQGFGSKLIRSASQHLMSTRPVRAIHAYVKPENLASLRVFRCAGYTDAGMSAIKGQPAFHFITSADTI